MPTPSAEFDRHMMDIALRMARRGLGATAPNPSVGAVVVDEATGEVIARGWTQPGGRPHAEKEALRRAGERARGRTMYLTLEPCAHTGRLPTCADAMVAAGLKRVVCAIPDPNPIVSGRGFAQLSDAGIKVEIGVRAEEARLVTLGHILTQTAQRPFVQLKMALDAGHGVAPGDGGPVWVTSPEARAYAHLLRAEADAILVGAGTVLADDPALTCRLPGLATRSPRRIILDSALRTPPTAKVFSAAGSPPGARYPQVWLATHADEARFAASPHAAHRAHMTFDRHTEGNGRIALAALLARLAKNGVTRLLVEGGPGMWAAFLSAGLVDEAIAAVSPSKNPGRTIPVAGPDLEQHFAPHGLVCVARRMAGPDTLHIFRRESE
ncbi:MAG: bifunctional diaminohydroxyphosphoribosylaminopyrimidine deaminase/5-amino-6-(5-phosphoribosylamino)uracil reductase RibD [Hyphomicrobiaceae bacterium]